MVPRHGAGTGNPRLLRLERSGAVPRDQPAHLVDHLTILVGFRFVGTWVNHGSFALQPGAQYLPFNYHIGTAYLYELPSMLIFVFLWLRRDSILGASIAAAKV